mgnify:CR=1 FL=1
MAYTVDWDTKVISIPQSDLVSLGNGVYKLDLEGCHQELRRLEWEFSEGLSRLQILDYIPPLEAGGVIYARFVLLTNGYTVTFEDGQYAVNLVGANTNIHDNTNVNQVSIRPTNSAGLQDLSTLLSSAYGGKVVIDSIKGQAGTAIPIGTLSTPCSNVTDAVTIAHREGIDTLQFIGQYNIVENAESLILRGTNAVLTELTIADQANVLNCQIVDAKVSGVLDGGTLMERCSTNGLNYVNGILFNVALNIEPITLGGTKQAMFLDCYSSVSGVGTPIIDLGGTGQSLAMRQYVGGVRIKNRTGTDPVSIDMASGHVIIDATCTGDPITIRGSYKLTVEAGATTPIVDGRTAMQEDVPTAVENATATWNYELP